MPSNDIKEAWLEGFELPEGAMPTGLIRILSWIEPDGKPYFQVMFDGQQSTSQTVGDLERAKLQFLIGENEYNETD